jgi:type IV pilus assembly protein PilC
VKIVAQWRWQIIDESQQIKNGNLEAESEAAAYQSLRDKNWQVLSLKKGRKSLSFDFGNKGYWSKAARKIASMLGAGLSLVFIVGFLSRQEKKDGHRDEWHRIWLELSAGSSLAAALATFKPPPDPLLVALVRAGEESGTLEESFQEAATLLEEEEAFQRKINQAFLYPLVLLVAITLLVYALFLFVIPVYADFFAAWDAELPAVTKFLFAMGRALPTLTAFSIALVVLGLAPVFLTPKKRLFHLVREGLNTHLPGWKQIHRGRNVRRFCSIWGKLAKAGISLLVSLKLMEEMVGDDRKLCEILHSLNQAVLDGEHLTPVLTAHPYFPAEEAELLAVGEESGALVKMLEYAVKRLGEQLERDLIIWQKMLEPALISLMACVVGVVAAGILLPIFSMSSLI